MSGLIISIPLFLLRHLLLSYALDLTSFGQLLSEFLDFIAFWKEYLFISIGSIFGLKTAKEVTKAASNAGGSFGNLMKSTTLSAETLQNQADCGIGKCGHTRIRT